MTECDVVDCDDKATVEKTFQDGDTILVKHYCNDHDYQGLTAILVSRRPINQ